MKSNKNSINLFSFLIYIAIALIVIITLLLVLRTTNEHFANHPAPSDMSNSTSQDEPSNEEPSNEEAAEQAEDPIEMEDAVLNFIRYPGLQMFCTVLKGNLASMWGKLPDSVGENLYVKTCCPSCYQGICESLCTRDGNYSVSQMTSTDVDNIKGHHINKNLDFELDEDTLNELINSHVLKMSINNSSFPVQVLLKLDQIPSDDFINNGLNYKCDSL